MVTGVFINLPVADVPRSQAFFEALGFSINPQFSGETAICVVLGENMHAMLLQRDYFATFCRLPVADATRFTEILTALGVDSRARVDEIVDKALAAGGTPHRDPQDHGWMFLRTFTDPDGHIWEIFHADLGAFPSEG